MKKNEDIVYAYFISKRRFGITTEENVFNEVKNEGLNMRYLENVSLERAVNWINYNIKNSIGGRNEIKKI